MMSLVPFEIKKLLKTRSALGALVVLSLALFGLFYVNFSGSPMADGKIVHGREAAQLNSKIAEKYSGTLTEEKLNQMFQGYIGEHKTYGQWGFYNENIQKTLSFFMVNADDYLVKVHKAIEDNKIDELHFKSVKMKSKDEVGSFFSFNKLKFGNFSSWYYLFLTLSSGFMLTVLFVVFLCSPVFSRDKNNGMETLLLTTTNGREKLTQAKILTVMIIGTLSFLGVNALILAYFGYYFGFSGWDTSVQMNLHWISSLANIMAFPVPMTMLGLLIRLFIFEYTGLLLILAFTLLISSRSKVTLATFGISAGSFFVFDFLLQVFPRGLLNKVATLFSISTSNLENILLNLSSENTFFFNNFTLNGLFIIFFRLTLVTCFIFMTYQGVKKLKSR